MAGPGAKPDVDEIKIDPKLDFEVIRINIIRRFERQLDTVITQVGCFGDGVLETAPDHKG